jgi:hypothetical protein
MYPAEVGGADELLGRHAEHLHDGRTHVLGPACFVGHRDDVVRVLHERAEAFFPTA